MMKVKVWNIFLPSMALCTVLIFAYVFWIAPLQGEDFAFARRFVDAGVQARLDWMLHKWPIQFTQWNARLGEQLTIFWLNVPKVFFLVASLTCFLGMNALCAIMLGGRSGWHRRTAIAIGMTFILWPGLELFFWQTVVAGYLHPLILNLACLVMFTSSARIRYISTRPILLAGLVVVAFLAGFSFENMPVAVAVYLLVAWGLLPDRLRQWRALLIPLAMLGGWGALMLMPSTRYRRAYYHDIYGVGDTDLGYYLGRAWDVTSTFFATAWPLAILAFAALALLVFWQRRGTLCYDLRVWYLLLPAILLVGSVAAAPYTEPRSFLLAWVIMWAFAVEGLDQLWLRGGGLSRAALALALACSSLVAGGYVINVYSDVSAAFDARKNYILEHLGTQACQQGLPVRPLTFDYDYRYFNNRDAWTMQNLVTIGSFYGCSLELEQAGG